VLDRVFGSAYHVRPQMPLSVGPHSEPEPDVTVVAGAVRDYTHRHPTEAELVIEISESTLRFDRTTKASLYASASVPDYWIVNLVERVLEVHRQPVPDRDEMFGWRYASVGRFSPGESVSPVRAPDASIPIADLLP
jgi:Uma2 family endonuclease